MWRTLTIWMQMELCRDKQWMVLVRTVELTIIQTRLKQVLQEGTTKKARLQIRNQMSRNVRIRKPSQHKFKSNQSTKSWMVWNKECSWGRVWTISKEISPSLSTWLRRKIKSLTNLPIKWASSLPVFYRSLSRKWSLCWKDTIFWEKRTSKSRM